MTKTLLQQNLELVYGQSIEDLLKSSLSTRRGQKGLPNLVAADLGLSDATFYNWCREFGIDIDEYRRPAEASTSQGD